MINIDVGEKLHVGGLEVIVIDADNANGRYKVQSTFDSEDVPAEQQKRFIFNTN